MGQVRSLPSDCALAPPAAARTSFGPGGAPSRRESTLDTHKGRSGWGGPGGALHVTFCPAGGAECAPRRPVPQRSSSTLAGQDRPRVVPSGLNEPQFPLVRRRNGKRDLARLENREITGVLERGGWSHGDGLLTWLALLGVVTLGAIIHVVGIARADRPQMGSSQQRGE
jgi:hypothetical protein